MLVVPERIRTDALFIDKESWLRNVAYFCYPCDWYAEERTDTIPYDHAGVGLSGKFTNDLESEPVGCDDFQIAWVREKFPGLRK